LYSRYESAWNEWAPELWNELGTDPPAMELLPPSYDVKIDTSGTSAAVPDVITPPGKRLFAEPADEIKAVNSHLKTTQLLCN